MPDRATSNGRRLPDPRTDRPFALPAEAYEAVVAAWPHCDERRIRTIADHWYAVAATESEPAARWERAGWVAGDVVAALTGSAGDDFAAAWQSVAGVADRLPPAALRRVAAELGRLAEGYAREVEAAKLWAWIELGHLAIDLLGRSVAEPPTAGPLAAGQLAVGLAAVRQVLAGLDAADVARAAATALRHTAHLAAETPTAPAETPATPPPATDPSLEVHARQRDEVARHFIRAAERQRRLARDAARRADEARRDPLPVPAAQFDRLSTRAEAARVDLVERARTIRHDGLPAGGDPQSTRDGLPAGGDPQPSRAALHDGDPAAPAGHRPPSEVHRVALDRAVPLDADGRVLRLADPRGDWFVLLNGPGADPARADNTAEAVLALYATYMLGRPRVAAPRAFDGYRHGEPDRPIGGDPGACARIEAATGGLFQGLCPDVTDLDPREARRAVDHAFTNLGNHLLNCGHGAFAVIAVRTEGGKAHLWAAVNHHGAVLHLDPQCRIVTTDGPAYRHAGRAASGNVVLMDALVLDGDGTYAPLPFHATGPFSAASPGPGGPPGYEAPPGDPSTLEVTRRAVAAVVRPHSPALADVVVQLLNRHTERPSDLTATLLDPARRDAGLRLLATLAAPGTPGSGAVPDRPRPGPAAADAPAPGGLSPVLLAEQVARIRHRVVPAVLSELEHLAELVRARTGATVIVTVRARSAEAILDAIERSPVHPRTGDVADVMDARLLTPDPGTLAVALAGARAMFAERIDGVRDTYTAPGPHSPDGPAVDLAVSTWIDDRPYAFTLRLVTLPAAVAAELGRQVLDGTTVSIDDMTRRAVIATMREAIASDAGATPVEDPR